MGNNMLHRQYKLEIFVCNFKEIYIYKNSGIQYIYKRGNNLCHRVLKDAVCLSQVTRPGCLTVNTPLSRWHVLPTV